MRKSAVVHMLCCFVNTFAVLIVKHMSNTSSHFEAAKHTKTSSRWRIDVLRPADSSFSIAHRVQRFRTCCERKIISAECFV